MAYKQPRIPPLREGRLMEYIRELILFLKDFCLETWTEVTNIRKRMVTGVNGKSGDVTLSTEDVMFLGVNPIASQTLDTPSRWTALGSGYASYNTASLLKGQPSRYGFILSFSRGGDTFQIWHSMPSGPAYVRSGNASGWNGTWRKLYDQTHPPTGEELLDAVYPVGAVYTSAESLSPAGLFGGEWETIDGADSLYRWKRTA